MILDAIIFLFVTFINFMLTILNEVISFTYDISGINVAGNIGYVFGNLGAFNTILPITETILLAGIALSFKAAAFAFQATVGSMNLIIKIKKLIWR